MPTKKPQWPFYGAWILLQGLCVPAAFILYFFISRAVNAFVGDTIYVDGVRHISEDYLFGYIFIPILVLLRALVQFGLLRRVLPGMNWWVPVTAVGWLVGLFLVFGLREVIWPAENFSTAYLLIAVSLILLGICVAIGQWLLLRQQLPRSGWWIVANAVGWGLLALIFGGPIGLLGLTALGLLPACATAAALAFLFNREPPPELQGV